MANYNSEFFWKGKHATHMGGTLNAGKDSIFIYINFITPFPAYKEQKQIVSAESVKEAAGYLRHIFLKDVINDNADITDGSPERLTDQQKNKVAVFLKYYNLLDSFLQGEYGVAELKKLCDEFSSRFKNIGDLRYQVIIADGADELRNLLNNECFAGDKVGYKIMELICSKDSFDGKELDIVIADLFDK